MITLVLGGSGSGKSEYAEKLVMESGCLHKYYLATMQVYGEEGRKKVERHKVLRQGKGFITIEQTRDIDKALDQVEFKDACGLLECMSNLVANEMFTQEGIVSPELVESKIMEQIDNLERGFQQLVIVSNNVFEDGCTYAEETMRYMSALGRINTALANKAERVMELVVSIPVVIK